MGRTSGRKTGRGLARGVRDLPPELGRSDDLGARRPIWRKWGLHLETLVLKTRTKQIRPDRVRSHVALTLLVLVAYASLINWTHHHGQLRQPASDSGISSGEDRNSSRAPASSDPSHCAACRLQRSFDSALRAPSISFDLCPQSLSYETCPREHHLPGASVIFSSRGPPFV
jgi:hypothetical protein